MKENSRQNLLLRTDILQKTVVAALDVNCEKQLAIGLIAALLLVHFLAVDLHDYNVKRPETSWFSLSAWRKCGTCSCSLFPRPLISFFSSAIKFVSVR